MKKEREEDIESNLAGAEETQQTEVSKSRWFTRKRKGILTSTADKKKHRKAYGINALSVI